MDGEESLRTVEAKMMWRAWSLGRLRCLYHSVSEEGESVSTDHSSRWLRGTGYAIVIVVIAMLGASLQGCTVQRFSSEDAGLSGASPTAETEELLRVLPEGVLSEEEALEARAALRKAFIEGAASSDDWLTVSQDGSFEAMGILQGGGSWDFGDGERFLIGLRVPEVVGDTVVYHVMPLVATVETPVTYMGERRPIDELLLPPAGESVTYDGYWVRARFSVQDRWIRADSIVYTEQESNWGAWPDDYPALADLDPWRLAVDAEMVLSPGRTWLDVRSNEDAFDLKGYWAGWLSAESEGHEFEGSFDVTMPDHLGSAAIYHVAQVFYETRDDVPEVLLEGFEHGGDPVAFSLPKAYGVQLVKGKLALASMSR